MTPEFDDLLKRLSFLDIAAIKREIRRIEKQAESLTDVEKKEIKSLKRLSLAAEYVTGKRDSVDSRADGSLSGPRGRPRRTTPKEYVPRNRAPQDPRAVADAAYIYLLHQGPSSCKVIGESLSLVDRPGLRKILIDDERFVEEMNRPNWFRITK